VLQLVAGGVSDEAYPAMTGTEGSTVSIPFADFRPAPWDTGNTGNTDRRITPEYLANLSQFNIFINQAETGTTTHGSFFVDDLRASWPRQAATPLSARYGPRRSPRIRRVWGAGGPRSRQDRPGRAGGR
jgi:hypothetical protein